MSIPGIDTEGLSDELVSDLNDSVHLFETMGDVSLVTDVNEKEWLTAELASASVNLFDGYTQFQNVLKFNSAYFIHLKIQKRAYSGRGGVIVVANSYSHSFMLFRELRGDFGKLSIAPGATSTHALAKALGHIFTSDEVFIPGHEQFNAKYNVHATDKTLAEQILSDELADIISGADDLQFSIVKDKLIVLIPGIGRNVVLTLVNISKCLP